jgi:hypothetical protein
LIAAVIWVDSSRYTSASNASLNFMGRTPATTLPQNEFLLGSMVEIWDSFELNTVPYLMRSVRPKFRQQSFTHRRATKVAIINPRSLLDGKTTWGTLAWFFEGWMAGNIYVTKNHVAFDGSSRNDNSTWLLLQCFKGFKY